MNNISDIILTVYRYCQSNQSGNPIPPLPASPTLVITIKPNVLYQSGVNEVNFPCGCVTGTTTSTYTPWSGPGLDGMDVICDYNNIAVSVKAFNAGGAVVPGYQGYISVGLHVELLPS